MRSLIFITEARFERTIDGKVYSMTGSYSLRLWNRYLEKFDEVIVVGRITDSQNTPSSELLASSDNVSFIALPYYIGFRAFIKKRKDIKKLLEQQAITGRSYLCRVPGMLGNMMALILKKKQIRYGVEVVGDPWDVFSSEVFKSRLTPLMKIYSYLALRKTVKNSSAALYVTKEQLQKSYPTSKGIFSTNASNVVLPDNLVLENVRRFCKTPDEQIKLLSVGYLDQMYKSPDIAIEAIAILKERGLNCILTWLGDGLYKADMVRYAIKKGVGDRVDFVGRVLPTKVRQYLLDSDIFILISRTEGLPRAVIEAMGAGLPCIGTKVGGIPELLENEALIMPGNAIELANKVEFYVTNHDFTNTQAKRNLSESALYKESVLKKRREDFYKMLLEIAK